MDHRKRPGRVALAKEITGKKQVQDAVLDKGGAGIFPMAVKGLVGQQRDAPIGPVKQVRACVVPPAFQTALRTEGRVLEENMPQAPEITQTVGVVQKTGRGHQVQFQPPRVFLQGRGLLFLLLDAALEGGSQNVHGALPLQT